MNQNVVLSDQNLAQLKCGWCKGVLSVPPICLLKGQFVCGRCNASGVRIPIYEELAKLMVFPCVYEECKVKLPWGKAKTHEEQCAHKTTSCPVYKCHKTFELRMMLAHFKKSHKQFILPNPAKASRKLEDPSVKHFQSDNKVFLTTHDKTTFLIFANSICVFENYNKNRITDYDYSFGVFTVSDEANSYKYEVTMDLDSDRGTFTKFKKDQKVGTFDQNVHCLECLDGNCPLKYHKQSRNFLATKFMNLHRHNNMRLTYTVHIYGGGAEHQAARGAKLTQHDEISSKLECPICKEYMCAPIYNCAKGHTLCGDCKKQVKDCPFCKAEIGKSRNYILEDISETLRIPCDNAGKGCKFVGLVRNTKEHQKCCSFN